MICSRCGKENDSFQTVCVNCSSPLTSGFLMCPVCGKIINEGTVKCPRCKSDIYVKEEKKDDVVIREAYTPKYIVDDHLSLLTIVGIMLFMVVSLSYNIFIYLKDLISVYNDRGALTQLILIFANDIRPIALIPLTILAIYTFIFRISINKVTSYEMMNKRLVTLKCLLLADATAFFTYFFVSYWPSVFDLNEGLQPFIFYLGAGAGIVQLIITSVSLPRFYKKARIRTR